ncbi:MAG: ash family protein [[Actinobacillus] rossii]|nr:ash family protein [[Actinobacillus] rossii]MDY5793880.1 ash family protein [[Actinobacillus] rossii]
MNLNHANYKQYENISQLKIFTKCGEIFYSFHALAKSKAERQNSNNLSVANNSAPCAFFIRGLHTPKKSAVKFDCISSTYEMTRSKFGLIKFLSMVACGGKGFALCCVPLIAVSDPVTRYRPKASELQAVTSSKSSVELSAMIYLFKAVNRSDLRNTAKHYSAFPKYTVRINADTLVQARAKIAPFFVVLGVVYA